MLTAYCTWKSYDHAADTAKLFNALKDHGGAFFLDSGIRRFAEQGRYSILGANPYSIIKSSAGECFELLRGIETLRLPRNNALPFLGGAVGFISYTAGFYLEEKLKKQKTDPLDTPLVYFGLYNHAVIVDHFLKKTHLVSNGFPQKQPARQKILAKRNLLHLEHLLEKSQAAKSPEMKFAGQAGREKLSFSREEFLSAVRKAKECIRKGDIYQVNLSRQFSFNTNFSAPELYLRLKKSSPADFSAYFDAGEMQVISSSPERFLKLQNDRVITRPMKGTRSRGVDQKQDAMLRRQLNRSAKERAELMMIVDLERNDLSRVCRHHSVQVPELREIEKYKTVYQATATVEGKLRPDQDRIDLIKASFPGGSVTGCPKLRAMQIIEKLEPVGRGLYTGALGYLSFCGNMDFNILIRTMIKKGKKVYFNVGGGIVADSVPQKEYLETQIKAQGMLKALGLS